MCCFKPLSLWLFVMAATENLHIDPALFIEKAVFYPLLCSSTFVMIVYPSIHCLFLHVLFCFSGLLVHFLCSIAQNLYSLGQTLMLGKIEGSRRSGQQRTRWLNSITDSMGVSLSKLQEIVKDKGAWHAVVHGVSTKSQIWLSNWTTTNCTPLTSIRF